MVQGAFVFEFFTPGVAKMALLAGAEFIMFDMEHAGLGYETLKTMVGTRRGLDLVPMARVPRGEYPYLARALDMGCHGVMIPMVESADQARAICEATHYPPRGRRGAAFGFANDAYEPGDVKKKVKAIDARTTVIAQIETERGLENVEEIAAVPDIDILWVGHFDLTNFLGIPAEFDNPKYVAGGQAHRRRGAQAQEGPGLHADRRQLDEAIPEVRLQHDGGGHRSRDPDQRLKARSGADEQIAPAPAQC